MSVTGNKEDGYTYQCGYDNIGTPPENVKPTARLCGWQSSGWPTRELAEQRGAQHEKEHKVGDVMPELSEFRESLPAKSRALFGGE